MSDRLRNSTKTADPAPHVDAHSEVDTDTDAGGARLTLLASAVAGRRLSVLSGDTDVAYTNGETVFLPGPPTNSVPQLPNRAAVVVAHAALVGLGSLHPTVMTELRGQATVARRYFTLELVRAIADPTVPVPRRVRGGLTFWDGPTTHSPFESLELALGRADIPECPSSLGTIRPKEALAVWGAADAAGALTEQQMAKPRQAGVDELADDEDSDESKIMKRFLSSPVFETPMFKIMRKQLGMGSRAKRDDGGIGDDAKVGSMRSVDRVGSKAQLVIAPPSIEVKTSSHRSGDRLYPEWDSIRGVYRPGHCAVGEFLPPLEDGAERFRSPADLVLQRHLAAIGLSLERHRHLADGDDLDTVALVDYAVAAANGGTADHRVFESRRKTARDLGVVVVLDTSGSTSQHSNGSQVWDQHRELAARLIGALERVGDRVAAFGFNSRGRNHVRFLAIKDFDQRFNSAAYRRLGSLQPGGYTRLGAAIRHATHIAREQSGTEHQLVVLVSDGFAYDDGYEGRYAEGDTRRAIDEALLSGVGCVCVSVAASTRDDVLDRLWGNTSNVRLEDASELSGHVGELVESSLRAAALTATDRRTTGSTGSTFGKVLPK